MAATDSRFIRFAYAVMIVTGCGLVSRSILYVEEERSQQLATCRLLATHNFTPALQLAEQLVQKQPDDPFNQLLLAEARSGLKLLPEAVAAYKQARLDDPELQAVTHLGLGHCLLADGQMRAAEPHLREVLRRDPDHVEAAAKLAFLLRIQGRIWESMLPVQALIRGDQFRGDEIHMLGSQLLVVSDDAYLQRATARLPDDPLPLMGRTKLLLTNNELSEAGKLLERLVAGAGDIIEVQSMYGWLLNETGRDAEFLDWNARLPVNADEHPGIWFARGLFLTRHQRPQEAARCFMETVVRSPNHFEATYRLSQVLSNLKHEQFAAIAGARAQELARVELAINELSRGKSFEFMEKAVEQLARVGRYWEAAALSELVGRLMSDRRDWSRGKLRQYAAMIPFDHSFNVIWNPITGLEPDAFPLPEWSRGLDREVRKSTSPDTPPTIAFRENASHVGLNFTYFNGSTASEGLGHIFETTGGGVAVLDVEADGWPDLWLAQGSDIWSEKATSDLIDGIFRNIDGTRFENITEKSAVRETGFSQGVAVGDIDSDGFPDVCVANVGPNSLYLNNGDGTFTDVTQQAGVAGNEWTLSPAIVDLNRDGHPELYCVNYLRTEEVLARRCSRNGAPLTCAPSLFGAEQDRVYLNSHSLPFEDVTESSGIVCADGKGLSLVAADFDQSGRVSLFIGNDSTNNFYFRNHSTTGGRLQFTEEAILSGLASDGRGRAQATMGIAAEDMNSDGRPDLFITNFFADPNTLYLSDASGVYVDATREQRLYDASYNLLGFGSQSLDADLDGRPDLIITNGHVDRSEATGEPDWMRPQFFRGTSDGFVELTPDILGPFFEQKFLGRALTRLDWNRDGRADCCISNLYHPHSLLTNTTTNQGNALLVRLIGTTIDRDAIGTTVRVDAEKMSWTRQLMGGDGYESSNERVLVFGLGDREYADTLSVHWLSGSVQTFLNVPARGIIVVIESSPELIRLPIKVSDTH
jgi:tetratricopeptide (TPR) repeat protein